MQIQSLQGQRGPYSDLHSHTLYTEALVTLHNICSLCSAGSSCQISSALQFSYARHAAPGDSAQPVALQEVQLSTGTTVALMCLDEVCADSVPASPYDMPRTSLELGSPIW